MSNVVEMNNNIEAAINKLQNEKRKADEMMVPVVDYLVSIMNEDIAAKAIPDNKNLKNCQDYITSKAKEMLTGRAGAVAVTSTKVFTWAVEYFMDDTKVAKATVKDVEEEKSEKTTVQNNGHVEQETTVTKKPKKEKQEQVNVNQTSIFDFLG